MKNGGKRAGAGRPKGSQNKATLERRAVQEAFDQRVMRKADALFNAQLSLAIGTAKVFRIDEEGTGKNKKRVHTLVTDEDEIKALLDGYDGGAGTVDGSFYYITTTSPDNKAIEALLNRALGKPKETREIITNPEDTLTRVRTVFERVLRTAGEDYKGVPAEDIPRRVFEDVLETLESDIPQIREQVQFGDVVKELGNIG